MSSTSSKIARISGRAVAVRGDDIDTDRIIPARYLKTITFEGLGDHLFEDDRAEATRNGQVHPLDRPDHHGARLLIGQSNFGCGSSREHAPQAILRWGIRAVVAGSFAEIFAGNSVMIGLPCVSALPDEIDALIALCESQPSLEFDLDLDAGVIRAGDLTVAISMPDSARSSLLSGSWDATSLLAADYEQVEATSARLPYIRWAPRLG
ncbi:MAG: 3-isopropylmalate dehydratase small subunit [Vicinamibacterales bacterium]